MPGRRGTTRHVDRRLTPIVKGAEFFQLLDGDSTEWPEPGNGSGGEAGLHVPGGFSCARCKVAGRAPRVCRGQLVPVLQMTVGDVLVPAEGRGVSVIQRSILQFLALVGRDEEPVDWPVLVCSGARILLRDLKDLVGVGLHRNVVFFGDVHVHRHESECWRILAAAGYVALFGRKFCVSDGVRLETWQPLSGDDCACIDTNTSTCAKDNNKQ